MRRFTLRIHNDSYFRMVFEKEKTVHGSYDESPLGEIGPGQVGQLKHSTCGVFTGTKGSIVYRLVQNGVLHGEYYQFNWDMPWCGDNEFSQERYMGAREGVRDPGGMDYVRPESGDERAKPMSASEAIAADEVLVFVRLKDALLQDPWPPRPTDFDQPADNRDAKPTIAEAGQVVHVRDADVSNRKVVYVGLNDAQASLESLALERAAPAAPPGRMSAVRSSTPAGAQAFWARWKGRSTAEFVASISTLDPDKKDKLVEVLDAAPRRVLFRGRESLEEMSDRPRYDICALAELLAEADHELSDARCSDAEDAPLKRFVVSGHHSPSGRGYWTNLFYGHDRAILHLDDLAALGSVFPRAMAEVEDVFLAACNSGHWRGHDGVDDSWEFVPSLVRVFPNVKTVWAYAGGGPSGAAAVEDLRAWEAASRKADGKEAIVKASYDRRHIAVGGKTYDGYRSIVWTRGGDGLTPENQSWP
ncbi:MAG: hypothetical protein U0414_19110 [Polyangiaceae bacterium]